MHTSPSPILVDFPLRGVWISPNTPGTRVPSHGTDLFGERYAYDFVGIDPAGRSSKFYRASPLRYLTAGVRLRECYGWGQPIYAAAAGVVVQAADGWPERDPVHPLRDISNASRNTRSFSQGRRDDIDLRELMGNYVIVEGRDGYAVYVHAQTGSVRVSPGDVVEPGRHLANVGHSGNSTAPHLHFHLMDHPDPWRARGIPCAFCAYEVLVNGAWQTVLKSMPRVEDKIRRL